MDHSNASGAELLSCDVFDTMLTRRVGTPGALFLILGKRLADKGLIQSSPEAFARSRIEANRRARSNAGRGMALSDIYLELQFALGLRDSERDAIRAEELALESDLLVPVPGAPERLRRAREAGMAVAFLSDMYLDSAFIRAQLERQGLAADGDGCYVSCEVGCGKEDGRAFRVMARREGVELDKVVHRGNDPRADIAAASAAGLAVEPVLEANLNRYEEVLEAHSYGTGGLASVMAGAARLARLSVPAPGAQAAVLRDVAASVGGPAIASYVLWVLLRCRDLDIRRLYFLARDGHLLVRVAQSLIDTLGMDCEARCLHGVGRAWSSTPEHGSPDPGMAPDAGGRDALAYLRQEGLLDDSSWALVDAGWGESALGALSGVLRLGGGQVPAAFLFARLTDGEPPPLSETVPVHAYFSDYRSRRGHRESLDERFLELFCGAEQVQAVGYRAQGDRIIPVLPDAGDLVPLRWWGLDVVHEAILSFLEWLWLDASAVDLSADMRPAVSDLLRTFITSPAAAEARAWGTYPVDGKSGSVEATLAAPFTLRDLPHAVLHGQMPKREGMQWMEGGLAITPRTTRVALESSLALRKRVASAGRRIKRALSRD